MRQFVLHASNPKRDGLLTQLPPASVGEKSRYLYDRSTKVARVVLPECRVFLWGSKKSGKHGLFAAGICTDSDLAPPYAKPQDFDALLEIEHTQVSQAPISPGGVLELHPDLASLVTALEDSSLLEMIKIDDEQAQKLSVTLAEHGAGMNRMTETQGARQQSEAS